MNQTIYQFTATTTSTHITVDLSGDSNSTSITQEWGLFPVSLFAEWPQTVLSIGGDSADPLAKGNMGYFIGCISLLSVDGIQFPLNGLLSTSVDEGGFEVDDASNVDRFCNLCDVASCPNQYQCISDLYGEVYCQCSSPNILVNDTCVTPLSVEDDTLNTNLIIIAISMGIAVVVFGVVLVVVTVIVVLRKRQGKKKERRYSINRSHTVTHLKPRSSDNYTSNNYISSVPIKRRATLNYSINANSKGDNYERRKSVTTFQDHSNNGGLGSGNKLQHHSQRPRRKSCTNVESGIKVDTDINSCGRGTQHTNGSNHDVNVTDSGKTYESEFSSFNEQLQTQPSTSRATTGASVTSPDLHKLRIPLTPREQQRISLHLPSISLSQSESDEEDATDVETESFNTRISSPSGMGGSMKTHRRGSDSTEYSKMSSCATSQWYHNTSSDCDKETYTQASQLYHPQIHLADSLHLFQPGIHPSPMYQLPPTFNRNFPRDQSRATALTVGTDMLKVPRSHPQQFILNREQKRNESIYDECGREMGYKDCSCHKRQLSDHKVLDNNEYAPSSGFACQYRDSKLLEKGTPSTAGKHSIPWSTYNCKVRDSLQSSEIKESTSLPRGAHSINTYHSNMLTNSNRHGASSEHRQYLTTDRTLPGHLNYTPNQQAAHNCSGRDAAMNRESYQTLNSLSKIDPISNWDAQERMKIAIDHMDPCHLLSGPCVPFEYVSTDLSVIESQMTTDENHTFESQGGEESETHMPDSLGVVDTTHLKVHQREDEVDPVLTDSEIGQQIMNHFPSADCSSQYKATIVAGSNSTSGESTPKLQKVFVLPPKQQTIFDV